MRRTIFALVSLAVAVAVAAGVGGGRSAVAAAILLPAGVGMALVLWWAGRAAGRQRGRRRVAAYFAVALLALIELWAFAILLWAVAAIAEGLFPFDVDEHSAASPTG